MKSGKPLENNFHIGNYTHIFFQKNRYTINDQYDGRYANDFTIDAVTGIVKLAKELDFEDLRVSI